MIQLVSQLLQCLLPLPLEPMSLMSPLIVCLHYPKILSSSDAYCRIGMSGLTSQPPMGAICSALEQSNLGTGIRYADIQALNLYWSQVRILYQCFEANVRASDSSVFDHEMPGGQYTNLMVGFGHMHH
jgi:hypothetical protein